MTQLLLRVLSPEAGKAVSCMRGSVTLTPSPPCPLSLTLDAEVTASWVLCGRTRCEKKLLVVFVQGVGPCIRMSALCVCLLFVFLGLSPKQTVNTKLSEGWGVRGGTRKVPRRGTSVRIHFQLRRKWLLLASSRLQGHILGLSCLAHRMLTSKLRDKGLWTGFCRDRGIVTICN